MLAIRAAKAVMVAAIALFATLVAFGNVTDYHTNFEFVQHVLSMDSVFPSSTIKFPSRDGARYIRTTRLGRLRPSAENKPYAPRAAAFTRRVILARLEPPLQAGMLIAEGHTDWSTGAHLRILSLPDFIAACTTLSYSFRIGP